MVSAATTDGARLFQWGKRILQGITISLGPTVLWVVWWPGRSCTLRRGQVLVFINRHSPTMNLVEEKQRGLILPGLQSWPLQLIEHFSNTTSVAPLPAGPASCRPLYLLHLLNLSFTQVILRYSYVFLWIYNLQLPLKALKILRWNFQYQLEK